MTLEDERVPEPPVSNQSITVSSHIHVVLVMSHARMMYVFCDVLIEHSQHFTQTEVRALVTFS